MYILKNIINIIEKHENVWNTIKRKKCAATKDVVFNFSKYRDKRVDLNLLFEIAIIIFIWDGYKYCKFQTEINQVSIFYFLPVLKHIYPFSFISFNFLTNFLTNIFYDQLFFFMIFPHKRVIFDYCEIFNFVRIVCLCFHLIYSK